MRLSHADSWAVGDFACVIGIVYQLSMVDTI